MKFDLAQPDSLFRILKKEARDKKIQARTQESIKWFRERIKELGTINKWQLLKDPALLKRRGPAIGQMYMYFYAAKWRDTLPYFDMFPLIIMVDEADGGWYGLNLHYLSPVVRAKFLDKLLEVSNNKRYDDTTRLNITYGILKNTSKFKEFKPCFKHYLSSYVDSQIVKVPFPHWETAIFLPTESFNKKNKTHVWGESRRIAGI